jgi:hypothetical protein
MKPEKRSNCCRNELIGSWKKTESNSCTLLTLDFTSLPWKRLKGNCWLVQCIVKAHEKFWTPWAVLSNIVISIEICSLSKTEIRLTQWEVWKACQFYPSSQQKFTKRIHLQSFSEKFIAETHAETHICLVESSENVNEFKALSSTSWWIITTPSLHGSTRVVRASEINKDWQHHRFPLDNSECETKLHSATVWFCVLMTLLMSDCQPLWVELIARTNAAWSDIESSWHFLSFEQKALSSVDREFNSTKRLQSLKGVLGMMLTVFSTAKSSHGSLYKENNGSQPRIITVLAPDCINYSSLLSFAGVDSPGTRSLQSFSQLVSCMARPHMRTGSSAEETE